MRRQAISTCILSEELLALILATILILERRPQTRNPKIAPEMQGGCIPSIFYCSIFGIHGLGIPWHSRHMRILENWFPFRVMVAQFRCQPDPRSPKTPFSHVCIYMRFKWVTISTLALSICQKPTWSLCVASTRRASIAAESMGSRNPT